MSHIAEKIVRRLNLMLELDEARLRGEPVDLAKQREYVSLGVEYGGEPGPAPTSRGRPATGG